MVDPEDHKATKNKIHKAIVALGYPITILPPLLSLELPDLDTGVYPQVIVLCHYALRVWDRSHYGAWRLYGYSHGSLLVLGMSMDLGVGSHAYRPWSLGEVAVTVRISHSD